VTTLLTNLHNLFHEILSAASQNAEWYDGCKIWLESVFINNNHVSASLSSALDTLHQRKIFLIPDCFKSCI
jgi:hypothetical protein